MTGRKPGVKATVWGKKGKNKHPSGTKWRNKNSKKWRQSYKPLGQPEMFQYPNYRGARRRTAARNWKLIWINNEGKLPQSGEGKLPGNPGSPESPKEVGPKEEHTKAITIKLPKIKYKERILKEAREKAVTYKGVPVTLSADFSKETLKALRDRQ